MGLKRHTLLLLLLICLSANCTANQRVLPKDFKLVLLSSTRAVVAIGTNRFVLQVGQSAPNGVTLTAVDSSSANFLYQGQQETLTFDRMGVEPAAFTGKELTTSNEDDLGVVQLFARDNGFYHVDAQVNDQPLEFLIDTGADLVVLSSLHAAELGLNLENKRRGRMRTASGIVDMVSLRLHSVQVGGITIYDVKAAVIFYEGLPMPLLGMSFLRYVDMNQQHDRLELIERAVYQ